MADNPPITDEEILGEIMWSTPGKPGPWRGLEHPMQIMEVTHSRPDQYHYVSAVVYQYPPGQFWRLKRRLDHDGGQEDIYHQRVHPRTVTATIYETVQ